MPGVEALGGDLRGAHHDARSDLPVTRSHQCRRIELRRAVGRDIDVDDLVQETLLRMHRARATFAAASERRSGEHTAGTADAGVERIDDVAAGASQ